MYKYKKILSPILMILLSVAIISSIILIIFLHTVNVNNIEKQVKHTKYYDKVNDNITKNLKIYMSEEIVDDLLKNNKVKTDIDNLISAINSNTLDDEMEFIKSDFETKVFDAIAKENTNEINEKEYSKKMSNIYFNNLLPVSEIGLVQDIYQSSNRTIIFLLVVTIICAIISIMYLFNAGKQQKWLFVSIYNCIIFCILSIITFSYFNDIYYMNDAVASLIQAIINSIIIDIGIIALILVIVVIILNYFIYFRKVKKIQQ